MLLHELMHIKGQGFLATGKINVGIYGFTTNVDVIKNREWLYYSGGILSSIILFIILCLVMNTVFIFGLLICGWIQLIYGLYEGHYQGLVTCFRYIIYIGVFLFWLIIWVIK
jgi:hypothetical protein